MRAIPASKMFGPDSDLSSVVHKWDKATRMDRFKILTAFVNEIGQDPSLVERRLGASASLVFTRFTTAWRLSYSLGTTVTPHMKAIRIFLRSSMSSQFLDELLRIGGMATLLDLIAQETDVFERDKRTAFQIMKLICSIQPACTDMFCLSGGLRLTRRALNSSLSESTQMKAIDLIRYVAERATVQYVDSQEALILIAQPTNKSPIACKIMAIETLADLITCGQYKTLTLDRKFAHSVIQLLTIDNSKVQQQASRLLVYLAISRPELLLTQPIISQLCRLINLDTSNSLETVPVNDRVQRLVSASDTNSVLSSTSTGSRAARTLCMMAPLTLSNGGYMIECGVLSGLTLMYCNIQSYESQQIANQALRMILSTVPQSASILERYMGPEVYSAFTNKIQGAALHRVFTEDAIRRVRRAIGLKESDAGNLHRSKESIEMHEALQAKIDDDDGSRELPGGTPEEKDDEDETQPSTDHANEDVLTGNNALNKLAVKLVIDRGVAEAEKRANQAYKLNDNSSGTKNMYQTIERRTMESTDTLELIAAIKEQQRAGKAPPGSRLSSQRSSVDSDSGTRLLTRKLIRVGSGARSISQAVLTNLISSRRGSLPNSVSALKHQGGTTGLFVPMAIPNLHEGTVLMTQYTSHNLYDQEMNIDTQSTEKLLHDYNDLLKSIRLTDQP